MPPDTLIPTSLTAIPAGVAEVPKVSARKLFVSKLSGQESFRSTDPHGYLMPDLDFSDLRMECGSLSHGTAVPEHGTLDIGATTIGIMLPRIALPDITIRHKGETFVVLIDIPPSYPYRAPSIPFLAEPTTPLAEVELPTAPAALRQESVSAERELQADATVQQTARRIAQLSGLTDSDLARLFNVTRETYQRWRTGQLRNPTVANRRRLGLLARLLEDVARRNVAADQWLRNVTNIDRLTPYQLLERGRLDDAELLAAQLPGGPSPHQETGADGELVTTAETLPAFAPRREEQRHEPVAFDNNEDWIDVEADVIEDDE